MMSTRDSDVGFAARTLPDLFAEQVARAPHAVALRCGDDTLTYAELDSRSDLLAARVAAALPRPEAVVAVLLDRSVELVTTLLAVLKAGGAYLALDPADPPARTAQLLADGAPAVCVTSAPLSARLPEPAPPVLLVERASGAAGPVRRWPLHPDNLAYVSYTSGSTGRPKGVAVPHRAIIRLIGRPDWISWTEQDTFLQLAPVAFDASTWEIWAPLTSGATLVVAPAGPATPDAVATTVRTEGISVLWLTAGLFHQLVDGHLDALSGVRHLLAGGDVVSSDHVIRLLRRHPDMSFTNGYGPTENTTFTACWTTRRPPAGEPLPIGRAISGTRTVVLDERLAPVPVGTVGELYAGGHGLARGYLNQPRQTASRFVPDPDPRYPGVRLYRTGDLVRERPDGLIEFVGRADRQVKINGYRVEPGEVEAVIRGRAGVRDASVTVVTGEHGHPRLLAYVVPEDNGEDVRGLTVELRALLPAHLVPSAVTALPMLPLTANGKVDRAALPSPELAPRDVSSPYSAPRTRLEAQLAGIWQRALGVTAVGIHDDFFELGGHSLLAAELVRDVQRTLGVDFPAQILYLQPTVAELAQAIAGGWEQP